MGDPAGIGAEVTVKALASREISGLANFLVIGDLSVIEKAGKRSGVRCGFDILDLANVSRKDLRCGRSRPEYGRAAIEYLDTALEILKKGRADALVTGPVNKASINLFLHDTLYPKPYTLFEGHTEYLAARTRTRHVAMIFVSQDLKITLVTRHIALKDVPGAITSDAIYRTIELTRASLKYFFGIRHPKICVSGLNPHAGEGGRFGDEEKRVILPAVRRAALKFGGIYGPAVPDVVFYDALNKKYDAVVAIYHDQGLIPFKMLHFKDGVNLTVGLPFIRTSPDHGTAFDIAGKGIADPSSMKEAIRLACRLAAKRDRCSR